MCCWQNFSLTLNGQCTFGVDRSELVAESAHIRALIVCLSTNHRQTGFIALERHLVALVRLQLFAIFVPVITIIIIIIVIIIVTDFLEKVT